MNKFSLPKALKNYGFSLILLLSILMGGIAGAWMGPKAIMLKPLADIFINLMFTVVIPLVFFSITSSVASIEGLQRFGRIMLVTTSVFLFMGIIAALYMLAVTALFPPGTGFATPEILNNAPPTLPTQQSFLNLLTVSDFPKLFSRDNMLALIIFSLLLGCAISATGEKGKPFLNFLQSGMEIFMKLTSFILYYAPIGFFAYFAILIGQLGQEIVGAYGHISIIYYVAAFVYFIIGFTLFVSLSGGKKSIKLFWRNALPPSITALATCSSAASIPANLDATEKMGISSEIYKTVIPIGTIIHKQGSILGGIVKIAFLFTFFHLPLFSFHTLVIAIMVALLVGTVMGAIPSGGMLGEMLIISVYGFPPETLMFIAVISIIIDPPATMLNVTGNTVATLLINRWTKKNFSD